MNQRSATAVRLAMRANDYDPVATVGKTPVQREWQTKINISHEDVAQMEARFPQAHNTGANCERTPGLDVDIHDPDAAEAVYDALKDRFGDRGDVIRRVGQPPKFLIPFRTNMPFAKILREFRAPNGAVHRLEFLGKGQQFIAAGTHPDTNKAYEWPTGHSLENTPRASLPEIDEKEAAEVLDYLATMLKEEFGFEQSQATRRSNGVSAAADTNQGPVDIEAELAAMDAGKNANAVHIRVIPSLLWKATPPAEVLDFVVNATMDVADRHQLKDHQGNAWTRQREILAVRKRILSTLNNLMLEQYEPATGVVPPWLPGEFHEAWIAKLKDGRTPNFGFNRGGFYIRSQQETAAGEAPHRDQNDLKGHAHDAHDTGAAATLPKALPWPTPYSGRAATHIPLRNFILGQHYLIGASSITASPGGIGKSTLSLLDGVSLTTGRSLLTGEALEKRRRVWIWNAEDDIDEMERRIVGICTHYGINRADLDGWLFLDSGYDLPLDLAHGNGKGAVIEDKLIDLMAVRVKEREIEVVMLDPLVALHTMAEGDNPGHAKLIRTLSTKLAKPCNCAVDINAHTRKPGVGQDSMTVDDIRGAGAIVYSARSGRILHPMNLSEAEKYNIEADDRFSYYRLERAKANMAKRGTICWVRMIEVPIANRPDGSYGDTVAVPTVWTPPDAMEGITETISNGVASEIGKGEYKRDARAGASWAGRLVALRCGIDISTKSGKDRAKTILENLIKKGVLEVEIRTDKNRNSREYIVPGALHSR